VLTNPVITQGNAGQNILKTAMSIHTSGSKWKADRCSSSTTLSGRATGMVSWMQPPG
jgi:hypothetical protein